MPLLVARGSYRYLPRSIHDLIVAHTHPHPAEPVVSTTPAVNAQPTAPTTAEASTPVTTDRNLTEPMAH